MSEAAFQVHLVDDDVLVLRAIDRLLKAAGYRTSTYLTAEDFLLANDPAEPGCVVVDLGLPGIDGFAVQNALSSDELARPIIFLTGSGNIPDSVRAMRSGAVDFLTKPCVSEQLLDAISRAMSLDSNARDVYQRRQQILDRMSTLTPRESEVLRHLLTGRLNKQIAADLGTVEKTIKVHRARVMQKMGTRSLVDLAKNISFVEHPW
jgi:FixJ family two-component response regulator